MAPIFTKFNSLIFVLIHIGCLIISTSNRHRPRHKNTRKPSSPLSTSWSFIKQIFKSKSSQTDANSSINRRVLELPESPASSTRSLRTLPGSSTESDCFPIRHDIHACPTCGEIFHKTGLLEQHQAFKHAVSELFDNEPGYNIVRIIFQTSWPTLLENRGITDINNLTESVNNLQTNQRQSLSNFSTVRKPMVYRVMKIHNSPETLTRFEEYREMVKSNAAQYVGAPRRDQRCLADGNELLRFHCATFLCDLGQNGNSSICNHQYCSVCGIIRVGFSSKLDGISTFSTSWKGHAALPDDIEEEFRFLHVKRAMLVCRVIAGQVGCETEMGDKDNPGYDSLVARESGNTQTRLDEEDELIVFNPRAVLPCFVIAYTV